MTGHGGQTENNPSASLAKKARRSGQRNAANAQKAYSTIVNLSKRLPTNVVSDELKAKRGDLENALAQLR